MAMNKFIRFPWAIAGDKIVIPDASQPDGSVSWTEGFGEDYEKEPGVAGAKDVPRDSTNQLYYDLSTAIREQQLQGVPDFIPAALNGGVAVQYIQGAVVRGTDGIVYVSVQAANTQPLTNTTAWLPLSAAYIRSLGIPVGTVITISGDYNATLHADYLVVPPAPTNISRATYPELFNYWGTKYGAGDGSTTFGMYYLRPNYAQVAANGGNQGQETVGEVIAHVHGNGGSTPIGAFAGPGAVGIGAASTASTGGPANLAAGMRVIHLVKFR